MHLQLKPNEALSAALVALATGLLAANLQHFPAPAPPHILHIECDCNYLGRVSDIATVSIFARPGALIELASTR